jgi:hypothetical protein
MSILLMTLNANIHILYTYISYDAQLLEVNGILHKLFYWYSHKRSSSKCYVSYLFCIVLNGDMVIYFHTCNPNNPS